MILIPEIETVVILVPRTGSKALRLAIAERYPLSILLYRHMEADGVPQGYDRWRRVGVVRDPVDRLWSLYRFLKWMGGQSDGRGKWEPTYVEKQRQSAAMPFDQWIVENQVVFTSPYDSARGDKFYPGFAVRHPLPENRKSQFIYLRPDLGTEVWRYADVASLYETLGVEPASHNRNDPEPVPVLSDAAVDHVNNWFAWDIVAARPSARDLYLAHREKHARSARAMPA